MVSSAVRLVRNMEISEVLLVASEEFSSEVDIVDVMERARRTGWCYLGADAAKVAFLDDCFFPFFFPLEMGKLFHSEWVYYCPIIMDV